MKALSLGGASRFTLLVVAVTLGASANAACAKAKPEVTANAAPSVASVPPAVRLPAPAGSASATGAVAPTGPVGRAIVSVQDKLDSEKDTRPKDTPRAEDVYAALEKSGLPVTDRQQHVASIFGAKYCLGGKSGELAYSVCEYETAEGARSGREVSLKLAVPNREIFTNKKTTLTVRQPPVTTKGSEAAAKKSADVFAKL